MRRLLPFICLWILVQALGAQSAAVEQIHAAQRDQPFFLAAGSFLPYVPCLATQRWSDLYPDDDLVLPEVCEDDRNDTRGFRGLCTGTYRNRD